MRWPPVPPPASSTLNPTTTQRGTRNAERGTARANVQPHFEFRESNRHFLFRVPPLFRVPRSAFRVPPLFRVPPSAFRVPPLFRVPPSAFRVSSVPPSPNADQDTGRDEGDEQARPPVGDEWQRDTRGRKQGQAHAYVQRRGHPDQGGEPHGQQLAERVTRRKGDAEAEPHERSEQHEQGEHAQENPFLTDGREDEIGIRKRKVAELQ